MVRFSVFSNRWLPTYTCLASKCTKMAVHKSGCNYFFSDSRSLAPSLCSSHAIKNRRGRTSPWPPLYAIKRIPGEPCAWVSDGRPGQIVLCQVSKTHLHGGLRFDPVYLQPQQLVCTCALSSERVVAQLDWECSFAVHWNFLVGLFILIRNRGSLSAG